MRKIAFENIKRKKQGLKKKEYSPKKRKRAFMEAYTSTIKIIKYLTKIAPVYIIFGNVEISNSETKKMSKEIELPLPFLTNDLKNIKKVKIINNKIANHQGIKIGGLNYFIDTNWIKDFKPSDFKEKLIKAKKETKKAQSILKKFKNVNILVCHQPPYGILDKVTAKFAPKHWQKKHAGSKTILKYIQNHQPQYVFCGHIHEGKGMKKIGKTKVYNLGIAGHKIVNIN